MALPPPSSSSSFSYGFTYDVFLSFRGTDTRHGFTGNLWKALHDKGIHTFIDDEELQRGEEITRALVKAIEESRIAILVFSNNYAFSLFCLDGLVNIIERVMAKGRLVLPVFYDVDPSHVRHQTGSYGEALSKHKARFTNNKEKFKDNMERLQKWKMALSQVANLSGEHFKFGNEYEHEFIGKIVKEVSNKINRIPLHVADYPVGLESRVLEVKSLLDVGSSDGVYMVGVYGIGGMGKTTLAQALYNFIADQFECLFFLHNVRENSMRHGLEHLQQKLLSKTVGLNIKLGDANEGIPIIKQRLHRKKVLLVLDDVDKLKQMQAMVGGPDWFGPGSRVIITTKDKHLLASHGVERTYEVVGLNEKEALELLRWNAFKNNKVDPSYKDILKCIVTYASGLPLALLVIGSNLFGKSIEEWKSALAKYERVPNKEIQNTLKVSFDALEEDEQSVFLDIACCFKGYALAKVKDILHAHYGVCMKYHIAMLVEKSLIKIGWDNTVTLHDLIEDMGKEIVRQESPKDPGKRSRLWFPKDILQVLNGNNGTSEIEIIHLDFLLCEEDLIEWNGKAFKKMKNLKTLIIRSGHFSKGPKHLPNSLRVLEWWTYPSCHLPSNFHPKNLAIFKLPYSCFTSFEWAGLVNKKFMNIRVLNFDRCEYLTQIPDLSGLSNLEEFSFQFCKNVITVHDSVGFLDKLKILSANGCNKLRSFPPLKLASLRQLKLSYCDSLESFPEILVKMENITQLNLEARHLKALPFSFQNLSRLQYLYLHSYETVQLPSSIAMMPELALISVKAGDGGLSEEKVSSMLSSNVEYLRFSFYNLSDEVFPIDLTWFANVKELDLPCNNFKIVPECIKECRFLWRLCLDNCSRLQEIRGIPPSIKNFSALNCESMTSACISMLLNQELHEAGNTRFRLPRARIPKWFEHQNREQSISFWFRNNFPALALCVVSPPIWRVSHLMVIINGKKNFFSTDHDYEFLLARSDHTHLFHMLKEKFNDNPDKPFLENEWNHAELVTDFIESGIHVLKEKISIEDIRFTDPFRKRKLDLNPEKNIQLTLCPQR